MIEGDVQKGKPSTLYTNTKAAIEALIGVVEGAIAYATDTDLQGTYTGAAWVWGAATDHASLINLAWGTSAHLGTASRVAAFDGAGAAISGALVPPATNVLTLTNEHASTLAVHVEAGKTLTLVSADNYTLTIPGSGTAALGNASVTSNHIAVFDGDGYHLKDGGGRTLPYYKEDTTLSSIALGGDYKIPYTNEAGSAANIALTV
jgi:hypothetical protein